MKIGVLTSSRADYGIYLPLLEGLKADSFFDLEIIAFGTHTSTLHGYTLDCIVKDGYIKIHTIDTPLSKDNQAAISFSYGSTVIEFSRFWKQNKYDIVFCLGDRFEMSAAVQSGIPFGVVYAHIHGGETTLGAIDNIYRHQITLASQLHFTSSARHAKKVCKIIDSNTAVYNVGALSLEEVEHFIPKSREEFYSKFNIDPKSFALVTFHPETILPERNMFLAEQMKAALKLLLNSINLVITMPNADTFGSVYRSAIIAVKQKNPKKVFLIENFGKEYYFSAMHYASVLVGNTSSGIIEAASFQKYVINVGDRQKGREASDNVVNVGFDAKKINSMTLKTLASGKYNGENIYAQKGAVRKIIKILKGINGTL